MQHRPPASALPVINATGPQSTVPLATLASRQSTVPELAPASARRGLTSLSHQLRSGMQTPQQSFDTINGMLRVVTGMSTGAVGLPSAPSLRGMPVSPDYMGQLGLPRFPGRGPGSVSPNRTRMGAFEALFGAVASDQGTDPLAAGPGSRAGGWASHGGPAGLIWESTDPLRYGMTIKVHYTFGVGGWVVWSPEADLENFFEDEVPFTVSVLPNDDQAAIALVYQAAQDESPSNPNAGLTGLVAAAAAHREAMELKEQKQRDLEVQEEEGKRGMKKVSDKLVLPSDDYGYGGIDLPPQVKYALLPTVSKHLLDLLVSMRRGVGVSQPNPVGRDRPTPIGPPPTWLEKLAPLIDPQGPAPQPRGPLRDVRMQVTDPPRVDSTVHLLRRPSGSAVESVES
jgi:hypothetical protein